VSESRVTATEPPPRSPAGAAPNPSGHPASGNGGEAATGGDAFQRPAGRPQEAREAARRLTQRGTRRLRNLLAHWNRVATDERLRSAAVTYGRLDYPRAEIHLRLSSRQEFHRLSSCQKEPWTVRWIENYLRPGDVLYDIGANVGAYTLLAAVVVPEARVVSFEPGPANFAALCANVELNAVADRVTAIPIALGDRPHQIRLTNNADVPGDAPRPVEVGTGGGSDARGGEEATTVLVDRLDDLVERFSLEPPQHLKLDVDGTEAAVLAGGDRVLASGSLRSVMVELEGGRDAAAADRLRAHGFELVEEVSKRDRTAGSPPYGLFVRTDA
jgi:FkbM family methyltransferase